jgi:sterol desaturase/sphingolipid hydroxylase (fatty acid hydroxylase superfamily)
VPLIADLHHAHHAASRTYVSTPTWASLLVLAALFVAVWRAFSLDVALGTIRGLIADWLWYGIVHHVIHHRARRLAIALRVASHRHLLHHSLCLNGNFGVTTPVWDYLFGTHISSAARGVNVTARQLQQSASSR